MYFKKIPLIFSILSFNVAAETQSFDMYLAGAFQKDYCSISLSIHEQYDFDLENMGLPFGRKLVGGAIYSINCAQGMYDITFATAEGKFSTGGDNISISINPVAFEPSGVVFGNTPPTNSYLFNSNPFELTNVNFTTSIGTFSFAAEAYLQPSDGNWNDIGDSFSHTSNITVIFDKID